jgi:hypothetical protein
MDKAIRVESFPLTEEQRDALTTGVPFLPGAGQSHDDYWRERAHRAEAERDEARDVAREFFDHMDFRHQETIDGWIAGHPWLSGDSSFSAPETSE